MLPQDATNIHKRFSHTSVLLQETITHLAITPTDTVLDATVNEGGHSEAIAHLLSGKGTLVGIDLDREALERARERLTHTACRLILKEGNYRNLDQLLASEHITSIDKAIFDLGLSSYQLEQSGRGFSFKRDEPLQMTFASHPGEDTLIARDIVNSWAEDSIAEILHGYGEEQFARRIAKAIVLHREETPIQSTAGLVRIIEDAMPRWYKRRKIHAATKTFQALRIAVNDEIEGLKESLGKLIKLLTPGGRVAIISFHSLEDRVVKHTFRMWEKKGEGIVLTKKPVTAQVSEIAQNPRARSAKLRVFEKA